MRNLVVSTAVLTLLLGSATAAASPEPEEAGQAEPTTFTMGPPVERSFVGWTEVARGQGTGMPYRFGVMGDRLVGIGGPMVMGRDWDYVDPDDGRRWDFADRAWYSDDGLNWTMSRLPGERPQVSDLAVRPDGSMAIAVGYTTDERSDWYGAVWVTTDGVEWQAVMPPSKREVDWVAASDEVVAVSAGYQLWTTTDLEEWTRVKGSSPVGVTYGPGGFLAAEGGGQDLISPTALWHSDDGVEWKKVKLPKALRKASVGVSAYPLDEEWLLVPDKRGVMYRSPDGIRWRKVPRPPDMTVGYVSWLADLGEVVQAHGVLFDRKEQPDGVWTFRPGERVPKAKVPPEGFVESPVVWDDQIIGYGFIRDEDEDETMAMWRRQGAETEEEAVGGGELETVNDLGQRLEVANGASPSRTRSDCSARALDWVEGSAGGGAERFIEEASLFTTGDGPDETCSLLRVKPCGVDFAGLVEANAAWLGTADGWTGSIETEWVELPAGDSARIVVEDAPETGAGNVFVAESPFSSAYLIDAGDFAFELIGVLGHDPGQDREAVMQGGHSIAASIDILD